MDWPEKLAKAVGDRLSRRLLRMRRGAEDCHLRRARAVVVTAAVAGASAAAVAKVVGRIVAKAGAGGGQLWLELAQVSAADKQRARRSY